MGNKVAKFGGSSLSSAEQFKKVADIVHSDKDRVYVVPSAPGKRFSDDIKITDLFYQSGTGDQQIFDVIRKRYQEIATGLNVKMNINEHLDLIANNIEKGCSIDYLASRGEYLNGLLLADYLGFEFIDAKDLIFFDENGLFDMEATRQAFKRVIGESKYIVIPGFYGSMPNGEIKTFSRGGSDVTGSIVTSCTNSEVYENWTDVSGFLKADPRIVKHPKIIDTLSYAELRELSYMGATVLHEDCIFPVRDAGICIHVRNTNDPTAKGTMIVPKIENVENTPEVTGIAGTKGFTVIGIEAAMMNAQLGFGSKVLNILAEMGISFEHMPTGIDSISLVVADSELEGKLETLLEQIQKQCKPDKIEVNEGMALIATVGHGMHKRVGTSAKLFTALAKENINIRMINQGSSELNIIIGVENEDFENAIRAIYHVFEGE